MYTILLATDQPAIRENFQGFGRWEALGFQAPMIANDTESALSILSSHRIHALAIHLPPGQSARLYDRVHGMNMLYLEPVSEAEALGDVLERMHDLIQRQSQRPPTPTPLRGSVQDTFFQMLMDGLLHSEAVLRNRLIILDLPISADDPCLMITLSIPDCDAYLQDVWRYGRARLTMALRKFLQKEEGPVYYALGSLRAGSLRLLACPLEPMDGDALRSHAQSHLAEAMAEVSEYLGLEILPEDISPLNGLTALLGKQ